MLRKLKDADSTLRNMVLINNFITRLHWTVQNKSWAAVAELFWLCLKKWNHLALLVPCRAVFSYSQLQDLGLANGPKQRRTESSDQENGLNVASHDFCVSSTSKKRSYVYKPSHTISVASCCSNEKDYYEGIVPLPKHPKLYDEIDYIINST